MEALLLRSFSRRRCRCASVKVRRPMDGVGVNGKTHLFVMQERVADTYGPSGTTCPFTVFVLSFEKNELDRFSGMIVIPPTKGENKAF